MCPYVVYCMIHMFLPARDPNLAERRGKIPKNKIRITPHTKEYLHLRLHAITASATPAKNRNLVDRRNPIPGFATQWSIP